MDDADLTGPIEKRLGRWLLDRHVAIAVRYGHPFAVVLARTRDFDGTVERLSAVLRGADVLVDWAPGELLALLPDTPPEGVSIALGRLQDAAREAELTAVSWQGDLTDDLLDRVSRGLGAVTPTR